jgi:hypothetical protein
MITLYNNENGEYEQVGEEEDASNTDRLRSVLLRLPSPEYIWRIQQAKRTPGFKNASLRQQQQQNNNNNYNSRMSCGRCGDRTGSHRLDECPFSTSALLYG